MSDPPPPHLHIQLLGEFSLSLGRSTPIHLDKPRQRALLAYLAYHQGIPQARAHLAFTFWPDSEEKQALTNLRNLLHGLRQALPEIDAFLETDKSSITLKRSSHCTVDTAELQNALEPDDLAAIIQNLPAIEKLYRGDLLPKSYDEWIESERNTLHQSLDTALAQKIEFLRKANKLSEAIRYSKIRIRHEKLSESPHSTHIQLLSLAGDNAAALDSYQTYQVHLKAELDIAPSEALQRLAQSLARQTPHPRTSPPSRNQLPNTRTPATDPRKRPASTPRWGLYASIAAALAFAVLFFTTRDIAPPPSLEKSIAILPFENRSQLEEDRYFTDGFHDDLITRISHIPEVKTISRTSVMGYRDQDKDLRKIAKELGVTHIIEGAIQRSGKQIRINIQLTDASTGFHTWAKNYTKEISAQNIFTLQADVAEAIAHELSPQFASPDIHDTVPTQSLAALEAYFRGNASHDTLTNDGFENAIAQFQNAIALDPSFAQAHAKLAIAYLDRIHFQGLPVAAQVAKAQPHINAALNLSPQLSDAHQAAGFLKFILMENDAAAQAFQLAIKLNPNNAAAYQHLATAKMYREGNPQAALPLMQKAVELNPNNLTDHTALADILIALKRTDEAKAVLQPILQKDPRNIKALTSMGRLYDFALYRFDQAILYYRQAYALDPESLNLCSYIADAYFDLGDTEAYLKWSEHYLSIAPSSNRSTFLRGLAHEFRGETELAIASFAALKKSDDYYDWSAYKLCSLTYQMGYPQEALQTYLKSYPWIEDPLCPITKKNYIQVVEFAYLLHACGQKEEARALALRLKQARPDMNRWGPTGYHCYDIPLFIVLDDIPGAIANLQEFIDEGGALHHVATDPYTSQIHQHPEFQRLIGVMNARLDAQKTSLQKMEANGELPPLPRVVSSPAL
ncbi:tetratricopeptide repeat protein [Pelagicoccus sp. SDUM812005]|uniref:tetratricopeptide repeat protein n=1 Tax=Pelagicoccus sp. SDUM812005 TaxID=3041257 RepID=UPI00280C49CE|nr:tetratricopeptide repeat protein [Pelagicoccus sp. SDUM812005]MDQ8179438.1 tetratricopeptide repeat protein [Pelagicoccus sp. SDUM812005]